MEGENSSSSGQRASRGRRQGGPDRGHRDRRARRRAGGVYSRSASPIEMQRANTPILAPSHNPITTLIPLEEVVIEASLFSGFSRSRVHRGEFRGQGGGDSQVCSHFSFGGLECRR
jgi:hypothetical protein